VILHCTDPDVNRRWPLERIATLVRTPAEPPPAPPVVLTPQVTAAKSPRVPRWVYAALGIPVVALIFAAMPRSVSPVEPRVEATSVEPPRASVAAPVPKAVERPEAPVAPKSGKMWRVIAYAYSGQRPAAGKAKTINEKWPSFRAEVFTPKGRGRPPFLIAIGGRMTRQEALRLQKTARASGLPHDTYIQNYSD
jgi:hypothetical protein